MERIGIYGGTFNPPHAGHIHAAVQAVVALKLDKLIMIPAHVAPHKELPEGSPSPEQRLEMVKLAVQHCERIEVSDAICEAPGADGISCVGNKFVIWRFSEKCQEERNQTGRAKRKATPVSKSDPVRKGARARRQAARQQREQRNEYFRQKAIDAAIERAREKQLHDQD